MPSAEYMRVYRKDMREKRLSWAKARLGGRCVDCGSVESLEFDHINPATRVKCVTELLHSSMEKFMAEVDKCALRCSGCHQTKTAKQHSEARTKPHGTINAWRRGCKCDVCHFAKRAFDTRKKITMREQQHIAEFMAAELEIEVERMLTALRGALNTARPKS